MIVKRYILARLAHCWRDIRNFKGNSALAEHTTEGDYNFDLDGARVLITEKSLKSKLS